MRAKAIALAAGAAAASAAALHATVARPFGCMMSGHRSGMRGCSSSWGGRWTGWYGMNTCSRS